MPKKKIKWVRMDLLLVESVKVSLIHYQNKGKEYVRKVAVLPNTITSGIYDVVLIPKE